MGIAKSESFPIHSDSVGQKTAYQEKCFPGAEHEKTMWADRRLFGYGDTFDESKLKALPPGSFYTEPPSRNHFAETGDEAVIVQITGFGPSSTEYVDVSKDPRK